MSENLKKCLSEIASAVAIKDKIKRSQVLSALSTQDCFFLALKEIAANTVNQKIPLSKALKRKLAPHAGSIVNLSKLNKKSLRRKKLIAQSGGWILPLLPTVLSLITSAVTR